MSERTIIHLTQSEIQSGVDRVKWAEGLILQLPETHEGRNSWLMNYGVGPESEAFRDEWQARFHDRDVHWPLPKDTNDV